MSSISLTNIIAILCILSWRIFWMTMMSRLSKKTPVLLAFNKAEMQLLDKLVNTKEKGFHGTMLYDYLNKLARFGGYLGRSNDPPPGNMVMWRGLSRLTDITFGIVWLGEKLWVIERIW